DPPAPVEVGLDLLINSLRKGLRELFSVQAVCDMVGCRCQFGSQIVGELRGDLEYSIVQSNLAIITGKPDRSSALQTPTKGIRVRIPDPCHHFCAVDRIFPAIAYFCRCAYSLRALTDCSAAWM